jgi:hypothetical protein
VGERHRKSTDPTHAPASVGALSFGVAVIVGLAAAPRALSQCRPPLPRTSMICPILGLEKDHKQTSSSITRPFCALAGSLAPL